ncbi:MAG: ribosome small subunit-dependent GTPase A, partial [Bacilli bacterium]|nr:ribosome small subunit-dependent GTPase A [Bacilli bacterium]
KIHPRKNDLTRPFVSNVDKVFIITSFTEPSLNLNLLDRLITLSEWENIPLILVFTKTDLIDLTNFTKILEYYRNLGYPLYVLPNEVEGLKNEIKQSICVVAGQSGVGKSSLINLMGSSITLKTGTISEALGRGKHTTRHTELLSIEDGWVADTPGFGILDLEMDLLSLSHTFREFFPHRCKFSKCLHLSEPGCEIKTKVERGEILASRYQHYKLFVQEIKDQKKY